MVPATVYRLNGLGLLLGSVLLSAGDIIRVLAGDDPANGLVASGWLIQAVGAVLAVLGLPGIYASQMRESGRLGLLGFIGITVFLLVFGVFGGLLHGLVLPGLVPRVPNIMSLQPVSVGLAFFSAALLCAIGSLLLGIATIRAAILPRWTGALLIAGGLLVFFGHGFPLHLDDAGVVVLMAGLAGMGWSLFAVARGQATNAAAALAGSGAPSR